MMSVFLSSNSCISRRSFMRGTGAAVALPLLDAMRPAFAREVAPPKRLIALMFGLGFHPPGFFPKETGPAYTLPRYLEPLAKIRDQFTVFSGLSHTEQAGANGHTTEFTWLTSAFHPMLPGFKNSVSLDQVIAAKIGRQTRFQHLPLTSGGSTLAWTANGVSIPGISSPAALFKQLFINGTAAEVKQKVRELQQGKSILDTVGGEAKKLERSLGPADKQKVEDYLAAVRDMEVQLRVNEAWVNKPKPVVDAKPPTDIANRLDEIAKQKLMYDMIALALRTDSTRTITYNVRGEGHVPLIDGVNHGWHELSHHGQDESKIDELMRIELAEMTAFAGLLNYLEKTPDADGSLLNHTAVLLGSNLGVASSHDWHNLPILVAGGGFKHGQHIAAGQPKSNTPLCNLFLPLAQHMGVNLDKFGSSTKAGIAGFEAKT
jgi:hypothetical protein